MNIELDLKGLDRLRRKAVTLRGRHSIPASELLSSGFMRSCSRFGSFQEMIEASPFPGQNFGAIPDAAWDAYVRRSTRFSSWRVMLQEAAARWARARLFG
ncbi:MAG TPA: hypothetical protein VEL76_14320 [Gemmataceae bacterium]|nr:hypothetical protein [Gemmataceae bacterium]